MRRTVMFAAVAGLLTTPALARNPNLDSDAPLSGMVAVRLADPSIAGVQASTLPEYVKALVHTIATGGTLPPGVEFPLANTQWLLKKGATPLPPRPRRCTATSSTARRISDERPGLQRRAHPAGLDAPLR